MTPAPFLVLALPRSRTAWLSQFLTVGDFVCGHDELRHMQSLEDVRSWFRQPCIGSVETAAAPYWRLIEQVAPGCRVAVIRRPPAEVEDSLMAAGPFDRALLTPLLKRLDHKLDQIERRVPGVLSVSFADLAREEVCAALFEHCLPLKHEHDRWAALAARNVQINLPAMMRHFLAFRGRLDRLARIARHDTVAFMARAKRRYQPDDGMVIQHEPFDSFFRDGQHLFDEHLIAVGEAPGGFWSKNIALMRTLDRMGCMQIVTARSNGRMFGYLMTLISPSLERVDELSAVHTTFYASRDVHGLGMRLQREALVGLKARGVGELHMHAGVRGSGPRLGGLFRRLGAVEGGQMFTLNMREA